MCTWPVDRQAAASCSQGHEQVPEVLDLSLRGASGGPPRETSAHPGSPDTSADPPGQPQLPPASSELEPDFLPHSQLRGALEGPDLEAPPEQVGASLSSPGHSSAGHAEAGDGLTGGLR